MSNSTKWPTAQQIAESYEDYTPDELIDELIRTTRMLTSFELVNDAAATDYYRTAQTLARTELLGWIDQ